MKIAFIGLGRMGAGMAANILRNGHPLVVHDLRQDSARDLVAAGAVWAHSVAEAVREAELVFTSLPKPADVLATADQITDTAPNSLWFDLSTNALDVVQRIGAQLAGQGITFLDAPVSGGPAGAASGKLAIWVGGPTEAYVRAEPVLTAIADRARHVGGLGAGTIAKLVHNTIATTINHAVAEMMTVGVKAGMDPLDLYEAIRSGAMGRMRAFDGVAPRWLAGNLDPATFALELLHKDVSLGVELARSLNVPAPLATLARDDLAEALNRGWGGRDAQAALLLKQERAGIDPISAPMAEIRAVQDRT